MKSLHALVAAAMLLLAAAGPASAIGMGFGEARATAMGGAYTALATGVHAPWWNPANLAARRGPTFEIDLTNVGVLVGNDGISYGDFLKWVDDGVVTSTEIHEALDGLPGNTVNLRNNVEAGALSIVAGRFALTVGAITLVDAALPRGIFDALSDDRDPLVAYEEARTTGIPRDLSGARADVWGVGTVGVSYARLIDLAAFDRFAAGMTLEGFASGPRARVVESTGQVLVRPSTWQADARLVTELNGMRIKRTKTVDNAGKETTKTEVEVDKTVPWGLGMNLGVAGLWRKKTYFSVALHNIPLRKITWKSGERRTYTINNGSRIVNAQTLANDKPEGMSTQDYLDSLFAPAGGKVEQVEKLGSASAAVPSYLRAGLARDFFGDRITLTADVEQGLSNTAITSTTPRVATGVELRPLGNWVPLRAGMSIGGQQGHFATLGFGLHLLALHFDFALVSQGSFTPFEVPFAKSATGLGVAMETKLSF